MKYDVIIIGAGPGGIFSAYELKKRTPKLRVAIFEAGHPLDKRRCPIDGDKIKSCINCKVCSVMSGFGGAGAFSDGKYNFTTAFGGWLTDFMDRAEVMDLINEQEGWYKKLRDLIARCHPVPVTVVDTINAVMQAQWQRGTRWAADHARSLYEEVKALADKGEAAVPNEKLRMMWLGRGMWQDFAFYQRFEEKYGAVFMWSMYLAMGADAYIRNNVEKDPLRALAARFIGMEDFLHMPPWNSSWFIQQAKQNDIDGVVYMIPENDMQAVEGSYFIKKVMEDAGIPLLAFHADPVNPRKWNAETMTGLVEDFIENRVIPNKEKKQQK